MQADDTFTAVGGGARSQPASLTFWWWTRALPAFDTLRDYRPLVSTRVLGPGLLIGGALMLFVYLWCKWKGWGKNDGDGRLSLGVAASDLAFVAGFGAVVWLARRVTADETAHLLAPGAYLVVFLIVPRLRRIATAHAGLALLMPVIILGGIYGGIFTPTEASAVAVFYALLVGLVREIRWGFVPLF